MAAFAIFTPRGESSRCQISIDRDNFNPGLFQKSLQFEHRNGATSSFQNNASFNECDR